MAVAPPARVAVASMATLTRRAIVRNWQSAVSLAILVLMLPLGVHAALTRDLYVAMFVKLAGSCASTPSLQATIQPILASAGGVDTSRVDVDACYDYSDSSLNPAGPACLCKFSYTPDSFGNKPIAAGNAFIASVASGGFGVP